MFSVRGHTCDIVIEPLGGKAYDVWVEEYTDKKPFSGSLRYTAKDRQQLREILEGHLDSLEFGQLEEEICAQEDD